MNLEDHLGDIIRKARGMADVTANAAARAAGLSEAELANLEDSGQITKHPDFSALAKSIGLNGAKLERIANGWLPAATDLSRWRQLRMFTSEGEGMTVNCYLIWDEATRAAALFDTGFDGGVILKMITAEHLQLRHIFVTHSHPDHIAALGEIRAAHPQASVHSGSKHVPAPQRNQPGAVISLGELRISHCETPGHAEDGVTYIVRGWPAGGPAVAIVGDAIFAGSMGRGNDSWELARQKVREHILTLPPETLLCPGHGPLTTVREELQGNPFF